MYYWSDFDWLLTVRIRSASAHDLRVEAVSALLALALILPTTFSEFDDRRLALTWAAMLGAVMFAPDRRVGPKLVILVMLGSALLAIPGAFLWGSNHVFETATLAYLTAPLVLFYVASPSVNVSRVLAWVFGFVLVNAAVTIIQGAGFEEHRAAGLMFSPNLSAAFLLIGIVAAFHWRKPWLALPLIIAILFTGSRWASGVAVLVSVGMVVARQVSWPAVLVAWLAAGLVALPSLDVIKGSYRLFGGPGDIAARLEADFVERMPTINTPTLAPQGFTDLTETPHNVPFRMAIETGLVAAALWTILTMWALWRGPRGTLAWWGLLVVFLLSMMEYYTWVGPMGAFWWLFVGIRVGELAGAPGERRLAHRLLLPG